MGDNNIEISLTDVVLAQSTIADQNELILQLMQQIPEMRVKMQMRQDLPLPGFAANIAGETSYLLPFLKYGSNSESAIYTCPKSLRHRLDYTEFPICFRILSKSTSSLKQPRPNTTHPQKTQHQTAPPPQTQNQNTFHPQTPHHT